MAPRPTRRRLSLRKGHSAIPDNTPAESKIDEANIFRISRAPVTIKPTSPRPRTTGAQDEGVKYYPISHKILNNTHQNLDTIVEDLGRPGDISSRFMMKPREFGRKSNSNKTSNKIVKPVNQKIIGVSVTSTVEATPYRLKTFQHFDPNDVPRISKPSTTAATTIHSTSSKVSKSSSSSFSKTLPTTERTPTSAKLVTEELSNIVSESNRSEFNVDERIPHTSTQSRGSMTPVPNFKHHTLDLESHHDTRDSAVSSSNSEPIEQRYEFKVPHTEMREMNREISEIHMPLLRNHGRKVGRHFEDSAYNQPSEIYKIKQAGKIYENQHPKIYGEPSKVYGEPSKVYGEPSKVYSEPEKVYSEPAKVYSEPAKVYGEPSKVYGEPSKVYGEPSKVYSQPSKVYGEPSKVYDFYGNPVGEPEEKNYEVDEAVSVGTNGNAHGPQSFTEATNIEEDGHKVGYVVEGRNYRKYRVEERTSDGFIVGEYGVVSHDDGSLRGVRYTADGNINPRLIYDALMKFLAL